MLVFSCDTDGTPANAYARIGNVWMDYALGPVDLAEGDAGDELARTLGALYLRPWTRIADIAAAGRIAIASEQPVAAGPLRLDRTASVMFVPPEPEGPALDELCRRYARIDGDLRRLDRELAKARDQRAVNRAFAAFERGCA